ncbi:response regulator transcription factor [Azospirillum sp. RWY-5-1]|uniref:Response regulator transcription factor n=1 Tax=Azospirillum oleiclasticum TaxID=2735135 RepID=A0ABX2T5P5_9PROT|nr:response regulator transcription factor [Azospirillum oleiclasticum]NYZ11461.1 response regulator transcription factor [Azospirillum oleiclasticum]NYZ18622.1 response regulator transcription factor [Azospirillum oleiclasticum]
MSSVSVALIDTNNLFRQGLKALFLEQGFHIVKEASSLKAALQVGLEADAPQIILIDPVGISDSTDLVRSLKAACPDARVVLLTGTMDAGMMTTAIRAGADGFLMKDISLEALAQSLRLVMMGETVFPSPLAALLINGKMNGAAADLPTSRKGVSQREAQILRCLQNGNSNKVIANHLRITEATVKVHLKSLLRKIDASNRTQAAIWGLNNGFADAEGQGRRAAVV